jgi:hypothetical protein
MRDRISLVLVEYQDGRVAVQALDCPPDEAKKLFAECKRADKDVRMSLINIGFEGTDIMVSAETKKVQKSSG